MSKRNWGIGATKANLAVLLALVLAACTAEPPAVAEPTQPLIQATATFTPSPIPPTFTPSSDLSAPGDVGGVSTSPSPASASPDDLGEDQVATELAALAQRRIAQEQDVPINQVEIVSIEAYVWQDTSLGCPEPGQTYAPVAVDGYRIVLEVRDTQVIFHTDFDRAIPCDPDLEQLPEN